MLFFALGALGAYPHLEKEEILYYRAIFILLLLFVPQIQIIGPVVEKVKPKEDFWNYITLFKKEYYRANAELFYKLVIFYYFSTPIILAYIIYLLCSSFF